MPRLSTKAFERAVQEALDRIPEEFLQHIENVAVLVLDEPSQEVLEDLDVPEDETLFGAYFGVPVGEKSLFDVPGEPDRIEIYRRPLEELCESVEELVEEIEITVVHEIAHALGIDEDRLAELGYD